jgi:CyaY protein
VEEREFNDKADAMLVRVEAALDACSNECDFDFETKPGGVLELEFENGSKVIINRHTAAREIWVAAKSGGYHFKLDNDRWVATRSGEELLAAIGRCMSEQSGENVDLAG